MPQKLLIKLNLYFTQNMPTMDVLDMTRLPLYYSYIVLQSLQSQALFPALGPAQSIFRLKTPDVCQWNTKVQGLEMRLLKLDFFKMA